MNNAARPPVSVIVPVFRHQPYLEPALHSILALDYPKLEIIIQDDASPDDAFDVVKRVTDAYDGPHSIKIGKNDQNLSMANFNVLMRKATADYIVAAHDDDIQYPNRISLIMEAFLAHDVSMVTSNARRITAAGDVIGLDRDNATDAFFNAEEFAATGWTQMVYGPALSWHREVFDQFGPIDIRGTARASDWIIPYRASLLKGVRYLKTPTFDRRVHAASRGAIGRNTDDNDIFAVENNSESVTQLIYMLETTSDARDLKRITPAEHDRLAASIQGLILKKCKLLARSRNRLHMKKLRATWISHASGPITTSDVPNLGAASPQLTMLTPGRLTKMRGKLGSRRGIVKALKGPPWYVVALRKPFQVRYWLQVRSLQREFRTNSREAPEAKR
ncbi:glycosyl transferase family 2 [Yoonia maricola]|uniref:Glycosyl transferase family 2 n=1 Tax=Yoonia maricola TaxID=420999 RepID=A0A2M8WL90_9RHOB|nr:glycosyltransferase [Yoonia maricola]PJI91694.1 glycosyl transferase family 2 [Yoonia maricola]